jgi:hypothetical protein
MLKALFKKLGRYHEVFDKRTGKVILERWEIFLKTRVDSFPFNAFLHKFYGDDEEDFHNHPWNYTTVVLMGGYYEEFLDGSKIWRGVGHYRHKQAEDFHRISLKPGTTALTLFMPGKLKREGEWHFKKKDGTLESFRTYKSKYGYTTNFDDRGINTDKEK